MKRRTKRKERKNLIKEMLRKKPGEKSGKGGRSKRGKGERREKETWERKSEGRKGDKGKG